MTLVEDGLTTSREAATEQAVSAGSDHHKPHQATVRLIESSPEPASWPPGRVLGRGRAVVSPGLWETTNSLIQQGLPKDYPPRKRGDFLVPQKWG